MSPFLFAGDVLQFFVSLRGAVLFPGQGVDAERISRWYRSHVHPQGETSWDCFIQIFLFDLTKTSRMSTNFSSLFLTVGEDA